MLPSLSIRNFRTLEDFHVPRLGRVNLIVGKNNSGKSSVLEALRIYAHHASVALLDQLVVDHDETLRMLGHAPEIDDDSLPYQNFFTGRQFPLTEKGAIYIGDREERTFIRISHAFYVEERSSEVGPEGFPGVRRVQIKKSDAGDEGGDSSQALLISSSRREQPKWISLSDSFRRVRASVPDPMALPIGFVPPGMLPAARLADLWDSIALTNYDKVVRDGLKIIEDRVEGIAFVKRNGSRSRSDSDRTAIVKMRGSERPVALNSMGDGMNRILQLLLLLVPAKGGFYLVDEFENGLHYSVQEKVWEMIFELARAYDVQVFAATHSWDCIEAFKNVAMRSEESAILFRVGQSMRTSEKGKAIATVFDKEALANLTQMDVEVR